MSQARCTFSNRTSSPVRSAMSFSRVARWTGTRAAMTRVKVTATTPNSRRQNVTSSARLTMREWLWPPPWFRVVSVITSSQHHVVLIGAVERFHLQPYRPTDLVLEFGEHGRLVVEQAVDHIL